MFNYINSAVKLLQSGNMIMNDEQIMAWNKEVMTYLKYYPSIRMDRLETNQEITFNVEGN